MLNRFIKSSHFAPCILVYHAFYQGERVYLTIYDYDIIIACANLIYMNDITK